MLDSRDNRYTMESDVNLYTQPTWKYNRETKKGEKLIPPGIEPGTLSVLDSRDNHYTMESDVNLHTQPLFHLKVYIETDSTRDRTGALECVRLT